MQKVISNSNYGEFVEDLQKALDEGGKVVITTLQISFSYSRYFVVVDYSEEKQVYMRG